MAEVQNSVDRFGGEFMIQDNDHLADIAQSGDTTQTGAKRANRQSDQSQSRSRQQGGDDYNAPKQGQQRQAH
jgi:hypothetical protein